MTYDEKIPDFALQPASASDEDMKYEDDGFDPSPYDRLLVTKPEEDAKEKTEQHKPPEKEERIEKIEKELAAEAERIAAKAREALQASRSPKSQNKPVTSDFTMPFKPAVPAQENKAFELEGNMKPAVSEGEKTEPVVEAKPLEEEKEAITASNPIGKEAGKPASETFPSEETEPAVVMNPAEEETEPVIAQEPASEKEETAPVLAPSISDPPTVEPVIAKPDPEPVKITPLANSSVYNDLQITTVAQKLETKVFIEEDILVPDVKPDLISILSMDGKAILASKEIQVGQGEEEGVRVTGEVALQTVYLPENKQDGEPIAIIQSRLPFKTDWQVAASPLSHLSITPTVEKVDYTVVNERKFRAKLTVNLNLKEYAQKNLKFFEKLQGEDLQLLKEKISMSHVALRKQDSVEIAEELELKDGSPKPIKLLKHDINIVENHKQITSEKMVINATIWCNILYLGEEEKDEDAVREPALFQSKTDFTQFILMDKEENIAGNKVSFGSKDLTVAINEDGENSFSLTGTVNTSVEIFQNIEKEVVSDLYHNVKDISYDCTEKTAESIIGNGTTEVSAREIFNIPENQGQLGKVIYISGKIKESNSVVEQGRSLTEGILESQIVCLSEDEDKKPYTITQEIPFRGSMEIPDVKESMRADNQVVIKDLWFDKINGKQVEVNASLQIETTVVEEKPLKLISNPCFVESSQSKRPAAMVIYITKKGDSLWKIAKKYKTTRNAIRKINGLDNHPKIEEGTRLLIVK